MLIKDSYKNKKTVISTELFPPRKSTSLKNVEKKIEELSALGVDYISITYGALASDAGRKSIDIAKLIKDNGVEPLVHLTGHSLSKQMVDSYVEELKEYDILNVLALRGDNVSQNTQFMYASDLVEYLNDSDLCIGGACYPEKHLEALCLEDDIKNLKIKVDNGCDFLITQLFYDNNDFYYFREECRKHGITVPISCGIMPITNQKQIEKIAAISGSKIPVRLRKMMNKFQDNPKALEEAGIAYMIDQIIDLIVHDVDGIHIYIMNKPYIYEKVLLGIKNILG